MDRREVLGDRRLAERRGGRAFSPADAERRSGDDRRALDRRNGHGERRRRLNDRRYRLAHEPAGGRPHADWAALAPRSLLTPALRVVAVSILGLALALAVGPRTGWSPFR